VSAMEVASLAGHTPCVLSVAFSPDDKHIFFLEVLTSCEGVACVWQEGGDEGVACVWQEGGDEGVACVWQEGGDEGVVCLAGR
jgi:hypothetical protein